MLKTEQLETIKQELQGAIPRHVGIIMDGNGRWAQKLMLPRSFGHKSGTERVNEIVTASARLGVESLTLYAFSTENWARPIAEVETLFSLFAEYFVKQIDQVYKNNVRLKLLGEGALLPDKVSAPLLAAIEKTKANTGLTLNLALNYGARDELKRGVASLAKKVESGELNPSDITDATIMASLDTSGQPEVDLIIRTGGDKRLSNFLLLQAAYAELIFTDVLWPDFSDREYITTLREYAKRHRRFGKV